MIHRITDVVPLVDFRLRVHFAEGITKTCDVRHLMRGDGGFDRLKRDPDLFYKVLVEIGGYGVFWDTDLGLPCEELFEHGKTLETPFDYLVVLSEAAAMWGVSEGSLRKAIERGKLIEGLDVRKFGKQWVVSTGAMFREYGPSGVGASYCGQHNTMHDAKEGCE